VKSFRTNVDYGNQQKSFKTEINKQDKSDVLEFPPQSISKQIKTLDNMNPELKTTKRYEKTKAEIEKGLDQIFQKVFLKGNLD
jgi:hypothetical protein